jgi:TPR repeat protein
MAAARGDAPAMAYLGINLRDGIGVKQDAVESVKWFRKLPTRVNPRDAWPGHRVRSRHGVTEDDAEALRLFRRARIWATPIQSTVSE